MKMVFHEKRILVLLCLLCIVTFLAGPNDSYAQFDVKWMSVGSLHNWYSEIGSEIEHGFQPVQQYGMQWPAIYEYQDMQAAKALWIGCRDFTDERGDLYPFKVAHVGPRVTGAGEFFPMRFEIVSRFEPPLVYVDGVQSYEKTIDNDDVDPLMKADRMIINVTNCQVGITMTRKIIQFSQQYHDNYIISDYNFTNTGNVDDDPEIELHDQTLDSVYFFFQYRWAVSRETRYLIGNATGWGINFMLDARGDGVKDDPQDEDFRAQYGWHGNYPPFTEYDNIGAPICDPSGSAGYIGVADTVGRLGSAQFVGAVTLHADTSPTDPSDDPSQPSTTIYESSDDPETSQNDPYNIVKMESEYGWMSKGHMSPRHADVVEPEGNFIEPTGDPALGTPGGFSACNGYGPYTLGPGDSIRIVVAEGASGLSRQKCIEIGRIWKKAYDDPNESYIFELPDGSTITGSYNEKKANQFKNTWVYTGRDSLFQTFRRAIANYESDYDISQPPQQPLPPSIFNVNSGGDRISLTWEVYNGGQNLNGFQIYRAKGQYDSTYHLIYEAGPDERSFDDTQLERGVSYYYYMVSVGDDIPADPDLNIPAGRLRSNRYYTQTYDPAYLQRPAGKKLSGISVVPNPYNISADTDRLLFPGEPNKIAFFNIPGYCTIKIYTEIGELIKTIEHDNGRGDEYWRCTTSSDQIVVSGIYIAAFTVTKDYYDPETNELLYKKGDTEIVKFVIIR